MFNRIQLKCVACGGHLTGGLDTFGEVGQEVCQSCFWVFWQDYGVADEEVDTVGEKRDWRERRIEELEDEIDSLCDDQDNIENEIDDLRSLVYKHERMLKFEAKE